jgi:phage tail sheath protein FI
MTSVQQAPGLYYEAIAPPAEPSPLRSDIAGFRGRTRRGPVGRPVRVTGWREYLILFGGLTANADTPFALRGYFENGGDVAHVVRLSGSSPKVATAAWDLSRRAINKPAWPGWDPRQGNFTVGAFRIVASSPGAWANGLRVKAQYRRRGASGNPDVDLTVRAADEPVEHLIGLEPEKIAEQVAVRSALIRIERDGPTITGTAAGDGPHLLYWDDIVLGSGEDSTPSGADYLAGLDRLADEAEVALVAMPDLIRDVAADDAVAIQLQAVAQAELLHDRLVLVDLPVSDLANTEVADWAGQFRQSQIDVNRRAAVAYYPWLSVQDPFGRTNRPLRALPPCGHVAGLISRYDRERGAHYTPANATLDGAIDVTAGYALSERAALNELGINVLRCVPGRGIQVWGGRTLHKDPLGGDNRWLYIAHRRLIHRLIRGIRRVAEPLVFENNDAVLWLMLTRAVTTILSEAYTAGGLKGARPEQAFRVRCDATTNPEEERDLGRVLCEIDLAPAVPMEFVTLRVALSASGTLDVFEK